MSPSYTSERWLVCVNTTLPVDTGASSEQVMKNIRNITEIKHNLAVIKDTSNCLPMKSYAVTGVPNSRLRQRTISADGNRSARTALRKLWVWLNYKQQNICITFTWQRNHKNFSVMFILLFIMWPFLWGCIKYCIQSIHLSVHPSICYVPSISSKSESCRNFKFGRDITLDTSNWKSKVEVLGQGHWE